MTRKGIFSFASALAALAFSCATAQAQTKTDAAVGTAILEKNRVRVIVATRPDPYQPDGGASVTAPASYVSGLLGANASGVKEVASLPGVVAEVDAAGLNRLSQDPNIAMIYEDTLIPPALFDSVGLIGADKLHAAGVLGGTHAVAILDTGIEKDNAVLTGDLVAQACFSTPQSTVFSVKSLCPNGFDVSLMADAATGCPEDVQGCDHGTHVAGIVTGQKMVDGGRTFGGVSPGAKILPVQVFTQFEGDVCGASSPCVLSFTSDQLRALDWLYKNRNKFKLASINMSLGGGYNDTHCDTRSPLTPVIERLRSKGILTVVAAGNNAFFDGISEPACISSTVSVSATDKAGNLDVSYSNVSTLADIAAPGTLIVSTVFDDQVQAKTGTSMATPHVAAAVALLKDMHPDATALELEAMLLSDAPTVIDPRTGITLARIDLGTTAPAAAATGSAPAAPAAELVEQTQFNSRFIIQGAESQEGIASALDSACKEAGCTMKPIGGDQYLLEMKVAPETDKQAVQGIGREELQEMLGKQNPGVKVFSDKLFAPM